MIDVTIPEIQELLPYMSEDERKEMFDLLERDMARCVWRPLPGPQTMAYNSRADVLGYGGAAGGGKTDLMIGSALTQHTVSYVLRREATQMRGIYNRLFEIVGGRDGFNGAEKYYRSADNRMIQFGSTPHLGDEMAYQGQARDLLGLDETSNFLEAQVRFLMGWVRTVRMNQFCQTILAFNPPTSAEGRWVVPFFGPWLDNKHPNPALPGELRWYVTIDGHEEEWFDGTPFPNPAKQSEMLIPQSRTFIPSRVTDNPFLVGTNYMATLQALPEPLRSQMLYGDFKAGMKDDPWQVIPTRWIEEAQARWAPRMPRPDYTSLGVDVARGGDDSTIIARCTADLYYDELLEYPGKETPDGPTTGAFCIAANRDHSPIHIDVIGVGASPYDFLKSANQQVLGINVSERSIATDMSGRLSFKNQRSELWWTFRELLDPSNNRAVALPPSRDLLIELAAPMWSVKGSEIYVESREDIVKRIGRSPDRATAVILAAIRTPRMPVGWAYKGTGEVAQQRRDYDPYKRYNDRRR